jgi:ABC-type branched-subunit amino acid transport system ATPase component
MRLRHLSVERFRGIERLDWSPAGRVVALIGPGDATKTTILDAIGLLVTPRVAVTFSDADFYRADPSAGFRIEGTISELPRAILADDRLGLELRGVDEDGVIHDEPGDFEPAVTMRLDVNDSLEPTWSVVSERNPDGRVLTARDRALLGVSRVGDSVERQFTFGRGTALTRLATSTDQLKHTMAAAHRLARDAVASADLGDLSRVIEQAERAAAELGAGPVTEDLEVRLDASPNGTSALGLHSNDIPLSAAGLGTRRLVALGLELLGTEHGAVLCVDEIEGGLEPHRVRHLLRTLRQKVAGKEPGQGQAIFTTHSAVALEELHADEISVVRTSNGVTRVRSVPSDLAAMVRSVPEAFLARRVLVCEGKSEIGVVRALDRVWTARHEGRSLAHRGVVPALGGGSETGKRAQAFAQLGYPTAVLADSDASFEPDHEALAAMGVEVVRWDENCCIEERAAKDLSWDSICALFEILVAEGYLPDQLVDIIAATPVSVAACERVGVGRTSLGLSLCDMVKAGFSETEVRLSFAQASKGKAAWFKRIDRGEKLGEVIADDPTAGKKDLGRKLADVERWCFAG